jgi:hypothetical protein
MYAGFFWMGDRIIGPLLPVQQIVLDAIVSLLALAASTAQGLQIRISFLKTEFLVNDK